MFNRSWDEVNVGEQLGTLEFPISWRTLMLMLVGTRDFMPYHYHPQIARDRGMRDAFVNTPWNQCLFSRFTTDWTGPDSDIRTATLQMVDQLVPGDTAVVTGVVTRKWKAGRDALVELSLTTSHSGGPAALSTTVVAMPSNEYGDVKPHVMQPYSPGTIDPEMPEEARLALDEPHVRFGPYPVSISQIMYLAEMTRDANPLYAESEYAANSRHGGICAPMAALLVWVQARNSQIGIQPLHPDPDLPELTPWPVAAQPHERMSFFRVPTATDVIVQKLEMEYARALRPDDRVRATSILANCSRLRETRRGRGYFVTFVHEVETLDGEPVGRAVLTQLQYGVPAVEPSVTLGGLPR